MSKETLSLAESDQQLVQLLQQLVQIPSWVADEKEMKTIYNENQVVDFLESWLIENTNLEIVRQPLEGGRFNLIAKKGRPDLVFLAHTDTVKPSENAPYDQLAAEIHDGKLWGRGATDMKSGVATMIQALSLSPEVDNVWMFLYADEEYDFLGMKAIIEEYSDIKPKLIVSSDGSDLQLGNGCRGLIEIRAQVQGETGHPAKGTGNSAIWEGFVALSKLKDYLTQTAHDVMGPNSFSLAYILGGAKEANTLDKNGNVSIVGQAGNVVPDIMEFVLDIRPAFPDLTLNEVVAFLDQEFSERGLSFEVINRKHNLGAWFTSAEDIEEYEDIASKYAKETQPLYSNPKESGYLDLQMLWEAVGQPPALMYGGGVGKTSHTPQEHITIEDLIKERDFFLAVLALHLANHINK